MQLGVGQSVPSGLAGFGSAVNRRLRKSMKIDSKTPSSSGQTELEPGVRSMIFFS
jgi:hypothetical protein